MTMFKTKAVILAEIETNYGVDPTPGPTTNAILCEAPEIEPIGRGLERGNVQAYFGARPKVQIGEGLKISFTTELKGSGAAGTAPEIGPLFEACGFTHTNSPATSDSYDPNSLADTSKSVTIWFYRHDILYKALGCRGSFSLDISAGEYGKIKWEFTGLYAGPADDTLPASPTFNAQSPPRFLSASLAIDSYAAICKSFKVEVKNAISKREDANAATGITSYMPTQRSVTGSIDPEVVTLATKNFWNLWINNTLAAFTATVGGTAGNRCVVSGPKAQIDSLKYGDRESVLTYDMPLIFTPNAGNDEIKFLFN